MKKFLEHLKKQCEEYGVKLNLTKSKAIRLEGFYVSGYFDEDVLACATGRKDYLPILVHESCHLDQYIEEPKHWDKITKLPNIDEWLAGKQKKNINKSIEAYKWLELDCEKRTIKKLRKYGIKCNKQEQTQKANAYVQFYNYIKETRKWCKKGNTPYSNKKIYSVMPKKFMPKSWYNTMPDYIRQAFIENKI